MTHEQNVPWCLNDVLHPSWHPYCPLEYLSHLLISIAECLEGRLNSNPNMWNLFDVFDSLMQKIWSTRISQQRNKNTHWDGEIHQLGTRIRSPYRRPQFKSARNFANLHKQSARRARRLVLIFGMVWSSSWRRSSVVEATANHHADKAMNCFV